jgi:phosphatidate cytidylyltransferase
MICGFVFLLGSFFCFRVYGIGHAYDFETAVSVVLLLAVFTRQLLEGTRDKNPVLAVALTIFGLLYVPALFNFTTKIVFALPGTGQFYVLYLVVLTKFGDMGAYLTGLMFGKHPLVPHISPKKTWEGFFGALAFSLVGSHLMLALMPGKLALLTPMHATVLGLILGFAAVIGDLAESVLKRSCGVKDSGKMLPGIGGVLDLIDSLLFTAPLLFIYLRLVVGAAG